MCALLVDAIPGQRLRFRLDGKLAEPNTARWKAASAEDKAKYWPILAERLLVEWRGQMLAGRGRRGKLRRAKPISRLLYKQAGEAHQGPALLPRREESRAWRHARVTPYSDLGRVTGFFVAGTARFLSYHHTGTAGRGIPYFDDSGRLIGWRGLRGQVTGVVRDLLPTATTIGLAVSSASTRWARSLPKTPAPASASVRRRRATPAPLTSRPGIAADPLNPPMAPAPDRTYPASDHRSIGVAFGKSRRATDQKYRTVLVDVAKFDADWQADEGFAIPPGGGGAEIIGRRRDFARFLERAIERGTTVDVPEVYATADGLPRVEDGRHRFSLLRDMGLRHLPVAVPRADAETIAARYGYRGPLPEGRPTPPDREARLEALRELYDREYLRAERRAGRPARLPPRPG